MNVDSGFFIYAIAPEASLPPIVQHSMPKSIWDDIAKRNAEIQQAIQPLAEDTYEFAFAEAQRLADRFPTVQFVIAARIGHVVTDA